MLIIGFDPGLEGAMAVISNGEPAGEETHVEIHDLPVMSDRRALDGRKLYGILGNVIDRLGDQPRMFVIEDVRYLPGTGASGLGTASMMHSKGVIEGALGAFAGSLVLVDAKLWQRMFGIKGGKKGKGLALEAARALYPSMGYALARVKDNNRADALLIAHWARRTKT
jgi:hypothetical protein